MKKFLKQARQLAYGEVKRTGMPLKLHVDLSCGGRQKVGQRIRGGC